MNEDPGKSFPFSTNLTDMSEGEGMQQYLGVFIKIIGYRLLNCLALWSTVSVLSGGLSTLINEIANASDFSGHRSFAALILG